jgi:hypothetical protein
VHWHGPLTIQDIYGAVIIASIVSAWITGVKMRRKIRRDLGRKATDSDLTSIDTWMEVDEVEQRNRQNNPLKPD